MKYFSLIPLLLLLNFLQAQTNEAVKRTFETMYPNAHDAKYSKDENNIYQVVFDIDDKEYEAFFDILGNWLKTKIEIEKNELPYNVQKALESFDSVESFFKVLTPEKEFYECVVSKKSIDYVVLINEKGRILKKVKEEDYED